MNIQMGEKIRALRKNRNLSQETLAQYLGVSFQAVSKWEKGDTFPDVVLIPAIASFFDISTDELFDFNRLETEHKILRLCYAIADYRDDEPERAEKEYRELLKQYPGNDIVINHLLYVLQNLGKHEELIELCKAFIQVTKDDDCRYDAARIMAETYKAMGEYAMCKQAIDLIPEFFFTHREEKALLLDGEDMFRPAWQQKCQSMETMISMTMRIADYYEETGDVTKARHQLLQAKSVLEVLRDDIVPPFWKDSIFDSPGLELMEKIKRRLAAL